jgi:hypothetical protein
MQAVRVGVRLLSNLLAVVRVSSPLRESFSMMMLTMRNATHTICEIQRFGILYV